MKKLLIIAVAICVCACRPNPIVEQVLVQADSLMISQPDSALILLEGVSPNELSGAQQRAYYALLLSQAYDKNYIDITNDSLIRIAYDYYTGFQKRDVRKQALVSYYLGQVQLNAGDYEAATPSFLGAITYGEQTGDHYLLGLAHSRLGQLYENQNLFPQAIEHYHDAFIEYTNADLLQHPIQSLSKIGGAYALNGDYINAIHWYQRADTSAQKINDTIFLLDVGRNIASALYQLGDIEQAKAHLLGVYEKYNGGNVPDLHADLFLLGAIYAKEGNFDQARQYFDRALNEDDAYNVVAIQYQLYALESSKGNHSKALTHLRKYHSLIDSLHFAGEHQSVLEIEKKYNTTRLEYENYKQRTTLRYILIGAFVFVLMALIAAFYFHFRHRSKIRKRDELINNHLVALQEADRTLRKTSEIKNEKERKLHELLEDRFNFFRQYYDMAYSSQIRPEVRARKIEELLNVESIENDTFALIRAIIEERDHYFFENLRQILPELKENEINLLCLVLTGFSTEEMCAVYKMQNTTSSQSIATKKYRLSLKIKEKIGKTLEEFTSGYKGDFIVNH